MSNIMKQMKIIANLELCQQDMMKMIVYSILLFTLTNFYCQTFVKFHLHITQNVIIKHS
jgi:hypothetical protein